MINAMRLHLAEMLQSTILVYRNVTAYSSCTVTLQPVPLFTIATEHTHQWFYHHYFVSTVILYSIFYIVLQPTVGIYRGFVVFIVYVQWYSTLYFVSTVVLQPREARRPCPAGGGQWRARGL